MGRRARSRLPTGLSGPSSFSILLSSTIKATRALYAGTDPVGDQVIAIGDRFLGSALTYFIFKTQLTELTQRKKELLDQLQQVEEEIRTVVQGDDALLAGKLRAWYSWRNWANSSCCC